MKKSVIKRRKRVVPATGEPETNQNRLNSFPASPSPTPTIINTQDTQGRRMQSTLDTHSPLDLRPNTHSADSLEIPNQRRASSHLDPNTSNGSNPHRKSSPAERSLVIDPPPIGIDFTGYQLDQRNERSRKNQTITQLPPLHSIHDRSVVTHDNDSRLSPLPTPSHKQGNHNIDERSSPSPSRPARLSSISSILNHPRQTAPGEDLPIDPSLSKTSPYLQQHRHSTPLPHGSYQMSSTKLARPSTSSDPGTWELAQRRERLRREAEEIRQALRAKERELAELDAAH